MAAPRTLLIVPLVAVIALAGCKPRGTVSQQAPAAQPGTPSAEIAALRAQNDELAQQLAQARAELDKGGAGTVGGTATTLGAGDLGPGFTANNYGGVSLGEDFAFAKGSAELNEDGVKAIEKLAIRLNDGDMVGHLVIVEGHTDDKPVSRASTIEKYTDNWGLSAARAASVARALQKAGVDPQRLRPVGRGQYAPVAPGTGDADRAKNRRVEIFVSK
jgi:chemotaxis protein MotB